MPSSEREERSIGRHGRPQDLAEAKATAVALHEKPGPRYTREALQGYAVSLSRDGGLKVSRLSGSSPPFTAHLLTVDLFFPIGLSADFISRERRSNKVDIAFAYLYCLPFCTVFTSSDNLHARTAPPFLAEDQVFIRGQELKADLAKLDAHYSALPDEVKGRRVMSFAHYPPTDGDFSISQQWDKLMAPGWRENAMGPGLKLSKEDEKKLVAEIQQMVDAQRAGRDAQFSSDEADAVAIERKVHLRRGNGGYYHQRSRRGRRAGTEVSNGGTGKASRFSPRFSAEVSPPN